MKNTYNDPFYLESSYALRSAEESGDYDFPALPAGGGATAPTMQNAPLPGLGGGPLPSANGGTKFDKALENAPAAFELLGSAIGMIKNVKDSRANVGTNQILAICGRKPLVGKDKKQAYAQCVQRVLNPPVQQPSAQRISGGMSTTTKVIIGVVVVAVLVGITILIVKLSKSKKSA